MPLQCEVCQSKDQEILFLREMLRSLFTAKRQETSILTPVYVNELGQTVATVESNETIEENKKIIEQLTEGLPE